MAIEAMAPLVAAAIAICGPGVISPAPAHNCNIVS
jgi:hypothetical protein